MTGVFSIFTRPANGMEFASIFNTTETVVLFGVPVLELRTQSLTRGGRQTHQYRYRYTTHAIRIDKNWEDADGAVESRTLDVKRRWKNVR